MELLPLLSSKASEHASAHHDQRLRTCASAHCEAARCQCKQHRQRCEHHGDETSGLNLPEHDPIATVMTTIRAFEPADTFHFNSVNLDPFTETARRRARARSLPNRAGRRAQ